MGFDLEAAKAALHHCKGRIQESIETLLNSGGTVPQDWLDALYAQGSANSGMLMKFPLGILLGIQYQNYKFDKQMYHNLLVGSPPAQNSREQIEREKEAIENIVPDIPESEEDYLDLVLDDEARFVQEYKVLLTSLDTSS